MIFVDTSYWIAAALRRDSRSVDARRLALLYADQRLLTTNHVVGETWTYINSRSGHASAVDFLTRVESSPRLEIAHVDADVEEAAWRWLRRRDERSYSFVDATSFTLMSERGVTRALAYDRHFAAAGFELLTQ